MSLEFDYNYGQLCANENDYSNLIANETTFDSQTERTEQNSIMTVNVPISVKKQTEVLIKSHKKNN